MFKYVLDLLSHTVHYLFSLSFNHKGSRIVSQVIEDFSLTRLDLTNDSLEEPK